MKWAAEFGEEYEVPKAVQDLVEAGELEDQSWRNDAAPSFIAELPDGHRVVLWVDHPDPEQREFAREFARLPDAENTRYSIYLEHASGAKEYPVEVGVTDNVREAIQMLRAERDRLLASASRDVTQMTIPEILSEIKRHQDVQRKNSPRSSQWKQASLALKPLFAEMARRQRE